MSASRDGMILMGGTCFIAGFAAGVGGLIWLLNKTATKGLPSEQVPTTKKTNNTKPDWNKVAETELHESHNG